MKYYLLMNQDNPILKFDLTFGIIIEQYSDKLPYNFENIEAWINLRKEFSCISQRQRKELFDAVGIKDQADFIKQIHYISLNDTFWIKREDDKIKWSNVSPFRKPYNQLISTYALERSLIKSNKTSENNYLNPVISTRGNFPHAWQFNKVNNITFIKAGTKYTIGGGNSGREPYSEYFTSQIARYLNFNCVHYILRNHKRQDGRMEVVTECKCFTTEQIGSVCAKDIGLHLYEEVIDYCMKLGESSLETCLDMLFLDCLTLNTDRHFENIEFIMNNKTLDIIEIAPIFDNNNSLLPRFIEGIDTFNIEDYITKEGTTFEELFKLVSKYKSYKEQLKKLKSFKLKMEDSSIDIRPGRLEFLNEFLQERIKYLEKLI